MTELSRGTRPRRHCVGGARRPEQQQWQQQQEDDRERFEATQVAQQLRLL
jgi:hypothetical protein